MFHIQVRSMTVKNKKSLAGINKKCIGKNIYNFYLLCKCPKIKISNLL